MNSKISEHLDRNNLHHAYLIEGIKEEILPEVFKFIESLGLQTANNPDFCHISIDNFKIDEALNLRSMGAEKGFSASKKIFVISVNNFSLDAEQVLLKILEEPIENTHFFLIMPETDVLLRTLVSRFYFISNKNNINNELDNAKKFISMPLSSRIDYLKEFLANTEDEEDQNVEVDSIRSKSLRFLNALEITFHNEFFKSKSNLYKNKNIDFFAHIFKARQFLRQPGSSTKSLMESLAIIVPNF